MAGNLSNTASSLSKLQSLNGLFAIYKKQGPTSADVLNTLKEVLLKGKITSRQSQKTSLLTFFRADSEIFLIVYVLEAGEQNPNPRKRKKQSLKMGHGGTLDSAASGVLGKAGVVP